MEEEFLILAFLVITELSKGEVSTLHYMLVQENHGVEQSSLLPSQLGFAIKVGFTIHLCFNIIVNRNIKSTNQ